MESKGARVELLCPFSIPLSNWSRTRKFPPEPRLGSGSSPSIIPIQVRFHPSHTISTTNDDELVPIPEFPVLLFVPFAGWWVVRWGSCFNIFHFFLLWVGDRYYFCQCGTIRRRATNSGNRLAPQRYHCHATTRAPCIELWNHQSIYVWTWLGCFRFYSRGCITGVVNETYMRGNYVHGKQCIYWSSSYFVTM